MSDSNKYFLFRDRLKKEWRVYHMSDQCKDAGDIRNHGDEALLNYHKHDYVMKNVYTLPFHQCDLFKGTSKDDGWHE